MSSRVPTNDPTIRFWPRLEPPREDRCFFRDRREDHQRPVRPSPGMPLLKSRAGEIAVRRMTSAPAHLRQRPSIFSFSRVDESWAPKRAGELRLPRSARDGDHVSAIAKPSGPRGAQPPDSRPPRRSFPAGPRAPQGANNRDPRAEQGAPPPESSPSGILWTNRPPARNVIPHSRRSRPAGAPLRRARHLRPALHGAHRPPAYCIHDPARSPGANAPRRRRSFPRWPVTSWPG